MSRDWNRSTRPLSAGPFDTLTCCPTVGPSGSPSEPVSWAADEVAELNSGD